MAFTVKDYFEIFLKNVNLDHYRFRIRNKSAGIIRVLCIEYLE